MGSWQGWFRALWRALLSRGVKEHVGSDHLGNKYYYIPSYKNWRGQTIREKRIVEAANKKEIDYEVGSIPTEWEAWIRKTRKTPPTMEEILKNENYREEMKRKSKELYEKDKLSQETSEELLPSPATIRLKGMPLPHLSERKSLPSPPPALVKRFSLDPGCHKMANTINDYAVINIFHRYGYD